MRAKLGLNRPSTTGDTPSGMRRRLVIGAVVGAVLLSGGVVATAIGQPAAAKAASLQVVALSNRADLVSGGDVLLQVRTPSNAGAVRVTADGRDVTKAFARRANGQLEGLVSGLKVGANQILARSSAGDTARLTVTNHPIGGPVFSGPQIQPWTCTTAANAMAASTDAQCNAPTVYLYSYKPVGGGTFTSYDPKSPPPAAAIAKTTTDQGQTVPYIVRDERGTLDRAIYDIAALYDPTKPWTPWAAQPGWNHKLGFTFGGGCAPGHSQATAQNPVDDLFLARGYIKAVSSINVNGNACNAQTSAEALMMIKEHITETYGPIRFTIGDGCSGGAEQQHSIAEKYPTLLDGLRPECDFPDLWTPAIWEKYDCALFTRYFTQTSPQLWPVEADRAAVTGGALTQGDCAEQVAFNASGIGGAEDDWQPDSFGCGASIGAARYHPVTNKTGVRCTLQDYNVNVLGKRKDGFANRPIDNVGVQWGLSALAAGKITPEQFVDLNEKIGDFDIDLRWQAKRAVGDLAGIVAMYQTGELSYGLGWAQVPEIDARADDTYDEHSNVMRNIDRARMEDAVGNHDSQVFWTEPSPGAFGAASPGTHAMTLTVMDQWLTAIEADTRPISHTEKVASDKPPLARDLCMQSGQVVAQTACDTVQTANLLPVQVAGAPMAGNVLKCQLKPIRESEYLQSGAVFTQAQLTRLGATFPQGICDWTKKGVGQQPPKGDWLDYTSVVGGRRLGPAPVSTLVARRG